MELKSRRDCTKLGALLFGSLAGGVILIPSLIHFLDVAYGWFDSHYYDHVLIALFVAIPPATGIGMLVGFETYRLASGSRPFKKIQWWTWLILFFLLSYWTIAFYVAYRRRNKIIAEGGSALFLAPIIYGLLIMALSIPLERGGEFELSWILRVILSLFLSDCLLVNAIGAWKSQDRLSPPDTHRFQFSLGGMMIGVLSMGSYVTGLVLIFGH